MEGSAAISVKLGDNYAAIIGKYNGEFVNEAVSFSDTDFDQQINDLYDRISMQQRDKLQAYIDNAMENFNSQDSEMKDRIAEIITYRNEQV